MVLGVTFEVQANLIDTGVVSEDPKHHLRASARRCTMLIVATGFSRKAGCEHDKYAN